LGESAVQDLSTPTSSIVYKWGAGMVPADRSGRHRGRISTLNEGELFMSVTIHLVGIPLVLLVGLILGGFGGFILGLRAGAKRSAPSGDT
jgi:hypothetical protein